MDDTAPIPLSPPLPDVPAIEEDQKDDTTEAAKTAQAYYHPAWSKVEERFNALLSTYGDPRNALSYKDLSAEEFKVRMLAEATVHAEVKHLMEDVYNAVEATEQANRPKQQSSDGG